MMNFDNLNLNAWEGDQDQGDIINAILEKFPAPTVKGLKERFEEDIEGGICYMLSMEWLRLIITGNDQWKKFGEITGEKDIIYYKQIAQNFCMYLDEADDNLTDYLTNGASIDDISVDREFVEICMGRLPEDKQKSLATIENEMHISSAEEMAKVIMDKKEKYFFIRLEMENTAHQVAVYKRKDKTKDKTKVYFYDPNIGTIKVKAETKEQLLDKVTRLMHSVWGKYRQLGYEIVNGYVRFVKKN